MRVTMASALAFVVQALLVLHEGLNEILRA